MAHWHKKDPLSTYIGDDTASVKVLQAEEQADGSVSAVLQGERFEKQIHTHMPDGSVAAVRLYPIMPPTSLQYPDYLKRCTACGKCIEACPEHILRPAEREYEVYDIHDAQGKPTMSFEMGYCRPNCHRCIDVCDEGALSLPDIAQKRTLHVGWAQFNSKTCITQTDNVPCDACVRHCPHKAIIQVEKNGQKIPRINPRLCTGCGACEFYCPARPKAIYVEGN
ncbi:MAG: 4Fe-4S dicluster domain-containing protein [Bacteroidales bacterium]|nr:4Fe-4S dicluster domain-containing protein [Bacteroidales bacterium]